MGAGCGAARHYASPRGRELRDRAGDAVRVGGRPRGQPLRRAGGRRAGGPGPSRAIVAPPRVRLVRETRAAVAARRRRPAALARRRAAVLGVGERAAVRPARRGARRLPVDVARTIEDAARRRSARPRPRSRAVRAEHGQRGAAPLAGAQRRHVPRADRATLSTQLARRVVELFFGRLDARLASYDATARPAAAPTSPPTTASSCRAPTRRAPPRAAAGAGRADRVRRRRGARRRCACSCARCGALPAGAAVAATVWSRRDAAPPAAVRARAARAHRVRRPDRRRDAARSPRADVVVFASTGAAPAPGAARRALAAGAVPVAARLPVYEELLGDGELRPAVRARRRRHARRAARAARPRPRRCARGCAGAPRAARAADVERASPDELEDVYARLAARRHAAARQRRRCARASAKRPLIDVDLHMHTDHSPDCATPGRGAARDGAGAGARRDRGHRPQRDLRRARGARRRPTGSRSSSPRRSRPPTRAR